MPKAKAMIELLMNRESQLQDERRHNFVIAIDNYFTLPLVMPMLHEMGIGCVGMPRSKRGWPPKELVFPSDATFNDLFWCINDSRNLVTRWHDNNIVLIVMRIIKVLRFIDDYGHWMAGVDLADQLISYYASDLRCRRTWMPMMQK
eukprot:IDg22482t1